MDIRHGDLALLSIDRLPRDVEKAESNILMTGSGGNDHIVQGGTVYLGGIHFYIIGYLVAEEGAKLLHPDHGEVVMGETLRSAPIPAGIYELRRQYEESHNFIKPVID